VTVDDAEESTSRAYACAGFSLHADAAVLTCDLERPRPFLNSERRPWPFRPKVEHDILLTLSHARTDAPKLEQVI
jgi:hypothetical protein